MDHPESPSKKEATIRCRMAANETKRESGVRMQVLYQIIQNFLRSRR
jgi:hypothetical protein